MNIDLTIEEIEIIKECLTTTINTIPIDSGHNAKKILKIDDLYNKLEKESEI